VPARPAAQTETVEPPEAAADPRERRARPQLRFVDQRRPAREIHTAAEEDGDAWVYSDRCGIAVEAYDFPAIAVDASVYVHRWRDEAWESDGGDDTSWEEAGESEPYSKANAEIVPMHGEGETIVLALLADDEVPRRAGACTAASCGSRCASR
jgi:hypothetical protein